MTNIYDIKYNRLLRLKVYGIQNFTFGPNGYTEKIVIKITL